MFIDIHSHMLFGIDDGSKDEEMTLKMLQIAESEGIKEIVVTPHFIPYSKSYDVEKLHHAFYKTKEIAKANNIAIELHLGNELYLDNELFKALESKECFTLANSDYLLVEFSPRWQGFLVEEMLYELMLRGYKIILAHVERYDLFYKNPELLKSFIMKGCYAQINALSLTSEDKSLKRFSHKLIKNNFIHFIATDAHSNRRRSPLMRQAYEKTKRLVGEESAKNFFCHYPLSMIQNKEIPIKEPIIRKKFLFR